MAGFTKRLSLLSRMAAGVLICCMTLFFSSLTGVFAETSSPKADAPAKPETAAPTKAEKEELVRTAVTNYKQGERVNAQEGLERAKTEYPNNWAVPYYLGLIYLEKGDRKGAIAQWQTYLKMAPRGEMAPEIRKNVTLLMRQEARAFAKAAVAREGSLAKGPVDDKTIAVASFRNLGSEELGPLGKGMAAMLITDLSLVEDLVVVDRIKLQALLEEMALGTSGLVDMDTAPKVGKLLKARHVTSGTLADIEQETLMIASAVVETDKNTSIGAQEAKGVLKRFYELEKEIACQVLEDLDRDCKTAPKAFNKIHTKSMPALVSYSQGLDAFDAEKYDEARDHFQNALDEDPQFELAATALLATPTAAMASLSTSQMISNASAGGPSSSVAATAVHIKAGPAPILVGSSGGGVGLPPVTAIVAGVAAVGGGAALAGGGGGGGDPPPPSPPNLTGEWKGTWEDILGASGDATFSMDQTNDTISGTATINGNHCLTSGDITGSISNDEVNFSLHSGGETVELRGTADMTAKTLNGTWTFTSSESGCAGDQGNFRTNLTTGGADIDW